MNQFIRVVGASLFLFVHAMYASKQRDRSVSESAIDIAKEYNERLFSNNDPGVTVDRVINNTPYLVTIDDENQFQLLGIFNENSRSALNYELLKPKSCVYQNACLKFGFYNKQGEHIVEKDIFLKISQIQDENQYVVGNCAQTLNFIVARKHFEDCVSSWILERCRNCNATFHGVADCKSCHKVSDQARRCKSVPIDLMVAIQQKNANREIITIAYKVKIMPESTLLHKSL